MCGYKDQPRPVALAKIIAGYDKHRSNSPWKALSEAKWDEDSDTAGRRDEEVGVGGIGNYFTSHTKLSVDGFTIDSTKFGPKLELYPGKISPYYNSKIETLEKNYKSYSNGKRGTFVRSTIEGLLHEPCVVFVERFFERDTINNTGYFKVERSDGGLIPLAGFLLPELSKENDIQCMGHTLVTRDPYGAIHEMGHHRSPVILKDEFIEPWLTSGEDSFNDRLEMVAAIEDSSYILQHVEPKAVTKRMPQARIPLTEGKRYEGLLQP